MWNEKSECFVLRVSMQDIWNFASVLPDFSPKRTLREINVTCEAFSFY